MVSGMDDPVNPFAQAWALIFKELKILVRDRQTLLLLFLMPAVFILFLSLALTQVYNDKVGATLPVVVDFQDDGEYAERLREILARRAELRLLEPDSPEASTAKARITVPDGFSDELGAFVESQGAEPFSRYPVEWQADPTLDASYRWFIEVSLALATLQSVLDSLQEKGEEFTSDDARAAAREAGRRFVVAADRGQRRQVIPTPLQQTVPGWSLFAMFFIVVPLSSSLMRDRQDGTLRRLMTYPVSRTAIVAGKLLPYLVVNVVQFATMLVVGKFVVPLFGEQSLQLGSQLQLLLPITLAAALAATGYGLLVASLSRSPEQAAAFGGTSVVVMAVIGGVMVPQFLMPVFMQKIAYISPLSGGLQAYQDVCLREAGFATVLPKLAVLLGFAAVCVAVAARRLREI